MLNAGAAINFVFYIFSRIAYCAVSSWTNNFNCSAVPLVPEPPDVPVELVPEFGERKFVQPYITTSVATIKYSEIEKIFFI